MPSASNIRSGGAAVEFSGKLTNIDVSDSALQALTRDLDRKMGSEAGWVKDLKTSLGERGPLAEIGKTLRGGGLLAGVGIAGHLLNDFSRTAVELRNAFAEGKIEAGEIVEKLAGGIPILGEFWQLGRNIRELLTGEEADEQKLLTAQTKQLELTQKRERSMHELASRLKEMASADTIATKAFERRMATFGMTGPKATVANFEMGFLGKMEDIGEKFRKLREATNDPAEQRMLQTREMAERMEAQRQFAVEGKRIREQAKNEELDAINEELNAELAAQNKLDEDYAKRQDENQRDALDELQRSIDETNKQMEETMKEHEAAAREVASSFGQGSRGTFNPNAIQSLQVGNDMRVDVKALRDALDFIKNRFVAGQAGITWQ